MEDRCRALETDKEAILASNAAVGALFYALLCVAKVDIDIVGPIDVIFNSDISSTFQLLCISHHII